MLVIWSPSCYRSPAIAKISCDGKAHISGDRYAVGCDNAAMCANNKSRMVFVDGFSIDRRPVLQSEYERCLVEGGCHGVAMNASSDELGTDLWEIAVVKFEDAQKYCAWRGGRIATPEEWEVAGRGPRGYYFPWGDIWDSSHDTQRAARRYGHIKVTYPRACTRPDLVSYYGVYDLSGNAPEFTLGDDARLPQLRGSPKTLTASANTAENNSLTRVVYADGDSTAATFRCVYADEGDGRRGS